jgi:hypothetical protein
MRSLVASGGGRAEKRKLIEKQSLSRNTAGYSFAPGWEWAKGILKFSGKVI